MPPWVIFMETLDATQKFQDLLKKIFQFETSDLDFGIYKILNYKRKQIENFIDVDLKKKVESAFEKYKSERVEDINQRLEDAKQKVIQSLGQDAFTPTRELDKKYETTPVGEEFLTLKKQKEEAKNIDEIKLQVFNDLYNFFSRYYEDGDFIPQYRYSIKKHKYAIPYDGEEVELYWANYDQYYTKTGTLFRDYTFDSEGYRIVFRIVSAKEELGSNKATKERFFILDDENPIEERDKELIIRFQYRELIEGEGILKNYEEKFNTTKGNGKSSEESNKKGKQIKQDKLNQILIEQIINKIKDNTKKTVLQKDKKNSKGNSISLLEYHLNMFAAKNTKDYFIHKNLKRFLSEQLDYFIKSEVLDTENIEKEKFLDKHITRAKVVKEIGETIIDFLSQIEDFQKKLWEKKKFVIKTDYVITLDKIKEYSSEEFLESIIDEILNNEGQLKEWQELGFGEVKGKDDLIFGNALIGKEWKKLPIDTQYFSQEFKEKILEKLTESHDLNDILDGLLIKSENWQALNLLLEKYKEEVQTIYIDPPFNKEQNADYLYNVKYKDSTWIAMLENRLRLARELLREEGSIFVRCDYNGNMYVRLLMNDIFGKENFTNEIIVDKSKIAREGISLNRFAVATNTILYYRVSENSEFYVVHKQRVKGTKWNKMHSPTEYKSNIERIVNGQKFIPPKGRHWSFTQEKIDKLLKENRIRIVNEEYIDVYGNKQNLMLEYLESEEQPIDSNWTDIPSFTVPSKWGFPTENTEILLKRVIESTSNECNLILDFFIGSGTTTAVSHKLKRKWLGVEMGEHFYTVVLPRMKKVLAYDSSGISKEQDVKEKYNENNAGGFFKYYDLEQYEQTLRKCHYIPSKPLFDLDDKSIYEQYVFLKDPKLLNALKLDYKNNKISIKFDEIYPNIDIAETLSNLRGKWIKRITKDSVILVDDNNNEEEIKYDSIDFKTIKPLIWW